MIFKESVHWSDGLFLQPHHMQQMQNLIFDINRALWKLNVYYPYGLIECEINEELLDDLRIGLRKICAIMPDGTEISMPGNASIPMLNLDIDKCLDNENFLIYLALPVYNENEANLNSSTETNRLYKTKEYAIKDENTGNNEISLLKRIFNIKLSIDKNDDNYVYLPICRLNWISKNINAPKLTFDRDYCPPFFIMSHDCVIKEYVLELMYLIRKKRDQISEQIAQSGYNTNDISGENLFHILQLSVLNSFESVISAVVNTNKAQPFEIYLKLASFLGELSALFPLLKKHEIMEYDHNNLMSVFKDLIRKIRSVLAIGGYLDYIQYDFTLHNGYYECKLKSNDIHNSNEFYLAINTSGSIDKIKTSVEQGDNFRLLAKSNLEKRTRGVKLKELRYPPRYLPAIHNALWFEVVLGDNDKAWMDICEENVAVIDLFHDVFTDFRASLFLVENKGE